VRAFAELSPRGDRIDLHFPFDPEVVKLVKGEPGYGEGIPGRRFVGRDDGGPLWRLPLDLESGQAMRRIFGDSLELGEGLRAWGRDERNRRRNLKSLALAEDAELVRVPELLPELADAIAGEPLPWLDLPPLPNGEPHPLMRERAPRPYQRADIAMMALTNPLNANQPGTGKTLEWIGSVTEAGLLDGSHLIVNLVTAHFDPWVTELARYQDHPILWGTSPAERRDAVRLAADMHEAGEPFWLVLGYDDIRWRKFRPALKDEKTGEVDPRDEVLPKSLIWERPMKHGRKERYVPTHPALHRMKFASFCIDEFHKSGLPGGDKTLFHHGAKKIDAEKRGAMSGTPMGGKPRRLFPVLQWLNPHEFTSFWTWAERWLQVGENDAGFKVVGGLREDREDAFYEAHARVMVRRMKREALPGLPEINWELVPCPMSPAQSKQYRKFEADAELAIDEGRISASNVLAEYTRLRQFANARQTIEGNSPRPTDDSGKLLRLLEKLGECGCDPDEGEPGARAIVASVDRQFLEVVDSYLEARGYAVRLMTGETKQADRDGILDWYRSAADEPRILAMTTQTGGVSLNLEVTGSVHVLDESWNPDDQEQLIDRGDRGERTTQLLVYTYRTENSIQEYIASVAEGKEVTNASMLNLRPALAHARAIRAPEADD
jgi:hypothetical protein